MRFKNVNSKNSGHGKHTLIEGIHKTPYPEEDIMAVNQMRETTYQLKQKMNIKKMLGESNFKSTSPIKTRNGSSNRLLVSSPFPNLGSVYLFLNRRYQPRLFNCG